MYLKKLDFDFSPPARVSLIFPTIDSTVGVEPPRGIIAEL
jgi:hypothetical protein